MTLYTPSRKVGNRPLSSQCNNTFPITTALTSVYSGNQPPEMVTADYFTQTFEMIKLSVHSRCRVKEHISQKGLEHPIIMVWVASRHCASSFKSVPCMGQYQSHLAISLSRGNLPTPWGSNWDYHSQPGSFLEMIYLDLICPDVYLVGKWVGWQSIGEGGQRLQVHRVHFIDINQMGAKLVFMDIPM